jgi:hypothetical protein
MVARGDRDHDIAAWFGVNQGRIAEVKAGDFGNLEAAPAHELPPSGTPGVKGRRARVALEKALAALNGGDGDSAVATLEEAIARFDANEG